MDPFLVIKFSLIIKSLLFSCVVRIIHIHDIEQKQLQALEAIPQDLYLWRSFAISIKENNSNKGRERETNPMPFP